MGSRIDPAPVEIGLDILVELPLSRRVAPVPVHGMHAFLRNDSVDHRRGLAFVHQ